MTKKNSSWKSDDLPSNIVKRVGRPKDSDTDEGAELTKISFKATPLVLRALDVLVDRLPTTSGSLGRRRSEAIRAALVKAAGLENPH